jgi:excinuclease ABC subunit C
MLDSKSFLATVTQQPGVYEMLSAEAEVLYVGKARNLKKRLTSYFQKKLAPKTEQLMRHAVNIRVTVTASENEALLLEHNLIQAHMPRFNILLRDDKSYPFLFLSADKFPRLDLYRGARTRTGQYFGPYPSVNAVRETLNSLQKIFRLRQCRNTFFSARTRPCLQYQIKRCTAPCVDYVTPEEYAEQVQHAALFLAGKDSQVLADLSEKMAQASVDLNFEQAAFYRDQIANLRRIQETQVISQGQGETDALAFVQQQNTACVYVLSIRHGRVLGGKAFFPKIPADSSLDEVCVAFIEQYYLNAIRLEQTPKEIIINRDFPERKSLNASLSSVLGRTVLIRHQVRTTRAAWLKMAVANAEMGLANHIADKASLVRRFEALQKLFKLDTSPERIECFDISHSQGEATVASCVVFTKLGPLKSDYRRFNIKGITPGDDYAAMHQALTRRYTRIKQGEGSLPDILLIDGGKGQLQQAVQVMEECQLSSTILLVGVAKGPERKAGLETLWVHQGGNGGEMKALNPGGHHEGLQLIQTVRDEAHRFAITGHRAQRDKQRRVSSLEQIEGIGARLKQRILHHFGGLQEVRRASIEDLMKVPGISQKIAERIFAAYR